MLMKSLLIFTACLISLALSQDANSTDASMIITSTPTTSTTTTKTNPTSTTSTSTTSTSTTTTTTNATRALDTPNILNFTIFKNETEPCLLLQFAIDMTVRYVADVDGTLKNESLKVAIPAEYNGYSGVCNKDLDTFRLHFWNDWYLTMTFTLQNDRYELASVQLNYFINSTWFPNASRESTGRSSALATDLHSFSANKGSSYKCTAKTTLQLGPNITFDVTHYQGEPFYTKDENKAELKFHTAVDCAADQATTSKLIPIVVGSALAFLVLLVLVAYLIGRRKHRTGYQSV